MMRLCCAILFVLLGTTFSLAQSDANIAANLAPITAENVNQLETLLTIELADDFIAMQLTDEVFMWITLYGVLHRLDLATGEQTELELPYSMSLGTFSNDGALFACNCPYPYPLLWDLQVINVVTGEVSIVERESAFFEVAFNQTGDLLATTSTPSRSNRDGGVSVWDLETQTTILNFDNERINANLAFSPNGENLALSFGADITVLDLTNNFHSFSVFQELCFPCKIGGLFFYVSDLVFSHDSTRVASMSPDGFVWIWDAGSGRLEHLLRDGTMSVDPFGGKFSSRNSDILFSPQDDFIITANGEEMRLWSVSDGDLLRTIYEDTSRIAFNPAGTLMATTDGENSLTLWGVPEN